MYESCNSNNSERMEIPIANSQIDTWIILHRQGQKKVTLQVKYTAQTGSRIYQFKMWNETPTVIRSIGH